MGVLRRLLSPVYWGLRPTQLAVAGLKSKSLETLVVWGFGEWENAASFGERSQARVNAECPITWHNTQ
jgi:hypothetical protein